MLLFLPLGRGAVWGEDVANQECRSREGPSDGQTHKHGGFGRFAQPQVLEPVLLVLALLRELFHPGLAGLQRGPRRGGRAAQQAHGPAPLRGLWGAAGIGSQAEKRRFRLVWAAGIRPLRNLSFQNVRKANGGARSPATDLGPGPLRTSASVSEVSPGRKLRNGAGRV